MFGKQANAQVRLRDATLSLRVIATTDLHAHLMPYDYILDESQPDRGLIALAGRIAELREGAPNTLLVDNGDTLEGTPLGTFAAREALRPHPMIAAMDAIGYDAATFGNHDFNFGLPHLLAAAEDAAFPVVLTNLSGADGAALLPRSVVLERHCIDDDRRSHDLRIGVIGLVPPQLIDWDWVHLDGQVQAEPALEAAVAALTALREDGVDVTLALCHAGVSSPNVNDWDSHLLRALAQSGLVDVLVAGHTHFHFPSADLPEEDGLDTAAGTICGIPAVQAGCCGDALGVIDLDLRLSPSGWSVAGAQVSVETDRSKRATPAIVAQSAEFHERLKTELAVEVGATSAPLHSYFDQIAPSPVLGLVAAAQRAAAVRLAEDIGAADVPLVAAVSPMRAGGAHGDERYTDIPAGLLLWRHVHDIYAFTNRLTLLRLTGDGLRRWLEHAARAFARIEPGGAGQKLLNPAVPPYGFDVVEGVSYRLDLSAPALVDAPNGPGRVRDLSLHGAPLAPDAEVLMAANAHRAGGGGGFMQVSGAKVVHTGCAQMRDVVADYLSSGGGPECPLTDGWSFVDLGGATVTCSLGAGALNHKEFARRYGWTANALGAGPTVLFERVL